MTEPSISSIKTIHFLKIDRGSRVSLDKNAFAYDVIGSGQFADLLAIHFDQNIFLTPFGESLDLSPAMRSYRIPKLSFP